MNNGFNEKFRASSPRAGYNIDKSLLPPPPVHTVSLVPIFESFCLYFLYIQYLQKKDQGKMRGPWKSRG